MSLGGLRKQFNKVNQYISETVGSAEPTKLDDVYNNMEKDIDTTNELVNAFIGSVGEYLQPNPVTRAKKATVGSLTRVSCEPKKCLYPQTEGLLATTLNTFGERLGASSELGLALIDIGDTFRQLADVKYQMEDLVKQNVFDPLLHLQNNELKTINQHRTKLKSRRLDYDCLKRSQRADEVVVKSEEKLEETKRLAEMAMHNVLSNDVEQISQLLAFVDSQLEYHRKTTDILELARTKLCTRVEEVSARPRFEHLPARINIFRRSLTIIPDKIEDKRSSQLSQKLPHHQSLIDLESPSPIPGPCMPQMQYAYPATVPTGYGCAVLDQMKPTPLPSTTVASQVEGIWAADGKSNPHLGLNCPLSTQQPQSVPSLTLFHNLQQAPQQVPLSTEAASAPEPCCRALFDFDALNPDDLAFKEGAIIELVNRIDDNWYEGRSNGKNGFFPSNYVEILVPLH